MKKTSIIILTLILIFSISALSTASSNQIKLIINGVKTNSDVSPQMIEGRVLVPIRIVSESLNMNVRWDESDRTVHITIPQSELRTFNSKTDFKNEMLVAIQCLYEIEYNLTEAFMDDSLHSNSHITRAEGWLNTVKKIERNLALYKDIVGMNEEYEQLVLIRETLTTSIEGLKGKFPRTHQTINYFDEYDRLRFDAYSTLVELEKSINP